MTKIEIDGMTCNHCKMRVEKALKQIGCVKVKVDLEEGAATADTRDMPKEKIENAIKDLGFRCGKIYDLER